MASLNVSQDDLKSLESARQKLATLVASITSMRDSIAQSNPLPAPASLETSASILQKNLESLLEVTAQNADLFQRMVVHPSTNFPGRHHESILLQLLRKKLEPDVELSVEAAREAALSAKIGPHSFVAASNTASQHHRRHQQRAHDGYDEEDDEDSDDEGYRGPDDDDEDDEEQVEPREPLGLGDVWFEAREYLANRVREFVHEEEPEVYTKEERAAGIENVRTGLRRNLDEDEEDEDDEDDEMEDADLVVLDQPSSQLLQRPGAAPAAAVAPGIDPELAVWIACHGDANLPPNVERLSQPKKPPAGGPPRR